MSSNFALISCDTPQEIIGNLENEGFNIIKTAENENILKPLCAHADILVHRLPDDTIVVDRDNFGYYENLLAGFNLLKSENSLDAAYPLDISLNGVCFKNYFIHNLKYTDANLLDFYSKNGYKLIDVRQGYTKCNIAVGNDCLITSDVDIYEKMKDEGEEILLIHHKEIVLPGFNYGFIGGTSGLFEDTLYFTGDIKKHSSGEEIVDFLDRNGQKFKILSEDRLLDIGSIFFLG